MVNKGKFDILNTCVSACDYGYLTAKVRLALQQKTPLIISPVTSQTLITAMKDKKISTLLNKVDFLPPDSQWVRYALHFIHGVSLKERVYGPLLMLKLCALAQKHGHRIYLYGTTPQTLKKLTSELKIKYPSISLCGSFAPPFRKMADREKTQIIGKILAAQPDIIFIGLGSPDREATALEIVTASASKTAPVIIPIGAAFDFIAQTKPQAPEWIGDIGLEWLFRLLNEPKRLWRRYLLYGPLFIALVIKQKIMSRTVSKTVI